MATKKDPRLSVPLQGDGPGAYLRKARLEADMSVGKVASALRLNVGTVEALEADAYERLPAPTFVRGYLRGYARVLGLPSAPVLEIYDRQGFEPPPLTTDVAEQTQAHTSDTAVRLVTYAVAVVLAVLVGLWWNSQEDGGFGITGDLFGWSPDTDQDPSLQDADGLRTSPDDGDGGGESVAMASDPTHDLPQEEEFTSMLPATDAASGDRVPGETAPAGSDAEGESSAEAMLRPDALRDDETSTVGAPAGDALPSGAEAVESAIAGAEAEGRSGATTALRPSTSSGDEGSAATASVEEATPGEIVEVESTPASPEGEGESVAAAPLQPGTSPGDEGSAVAAPVEEAASGNTVEIGSAPTVDSVPESAPDREAAASREPQSVTVAGVDPTGGTIRDLGTSPDGVDGEDATDEAASASLADQSAPETAGTTPDTGADPTAGTAAAQSGVVLEFVHESWVEVYDREHTRLFFGLVQPGRALSFDGPQPFDILLGYGKDVRVSIDGQAFDHTPYLKHGVARFGIGAGPGDGTDVAESADTAAQEPSDAPAAEPQPVVRGR